GVVAPAGRPAPAAPAFDPPAPAASSDTAAAGAQPVHWQPGAADRLPPRCAPAAPVPAPGLPARVAARPVATIHASGAGLATPAVVPAAAPLPGSGADARPAVRCAAPRPATPCPELGFSAGSTPAPRPWCVHRPAAKSAHTPRCRSVPP